MPIINVSLSPGRTTDQLKNLAVELTQATSRALEVPEHKVRIMLHEIPDTHWSTGGVTIAEEKASHG